MAGPAFVSDVVYDIGGTSNNTAASVVTGVTAGDTIVVFFGTAGSGSQTLTSITDGHNTYVLLGTSSALSGDSYTPWAYVATNVVAPGGTLTVTATFGGNSTFNFMHAVDVGSSIVDIWSGFANGTGKTATSPTRPTNNANAFLLSFAIFDAGGETKNPTWSLAGNAPNAGVLGQYTTQAVAGPAVATATSGTSGDWLICFLSLKTPPGPATTTPVLVGEYDYSLVPAAWLDVDNVQVGPFDADLMTATASPVTSAVAQKLGGLVQAATVAVAPVAAIAQNVGALRQSSTAAETFAATAAQKLSGLRQSATASEKFPSTIAERLGGLRQAATAAEAFPSTAAQKLGALRQSAAGAETFSATAAQRLGGLVQHATAAEGESAAIAQHVGGLIQSAAAAETFTGAATQRVGALRQSAAAVETFPSAIAQTVGGLRQSASVTDGTSATASIAQRVGGIGQAAAVIVTAAPPAPPVFLGSGGGGFGHFPTHPHRKRKRKRKQDEEDVARLYGIRPPRVFGPSTSTLILDAETSVNCRLGGLTQAAAAVHAPPVDVLAAAQLGALGQVAAVVLEHVAIAAGALGGVVQHAAGQATHAGAAAQRLGGLRSSGYAHSQTIKIVVREVHIYHPAAPDLAPRARADGPRLPRVYEDPETRRAHMLFSPRVDADDAHIRVARRKLALELRPNKLAEAKFQKGLRSVFEAMHRGIMGIVEREILPARPMRHDAMPSEIPDRARRLLSDRVAQKAAAYVKAGAGPHFDLMREGVDKKNRRAMKLLGIPIAEAVPSSNPNAAAHLRGSANVHGTVASLREEGLRYISNAGRDYVGQVRDVLSDPDNEGLRVEQLSRLLEERAEVSLSRAKLLATDQTLKLSSALNRVRQTAAGVAQYRWSTSRDERVRGRPGGKYPNADPSHWDLEGQVFGWDAPPDADVDGGPANPGEAINCRCVALPVVEDPDEDAPDSGVSLAGLAARAISLGLFGNRRRARPELAGGDDEEEDDED